VVHPVAHAPLQLQFTGTGAEYFRIWSVNLTLTVLTLGLYSAWAKVRRLQYFHQHTLLDGSAFDYVANPVAILLGRAIALVLLVLYYLAFDYAPEAGLAITVVLCAGLPYLLWQSNRFKARNTRYRGLSFGFDGALQQAYRVYLPPLVVVLTPPVIGAFFLGPKGQLWTAVASVAGLLTLPFFHAMFRRYVQSNLRYGQTRFDFSARTRDFAATWGVGLLVATAVGFLIGVFVGAITAVVLTETYKSGNTRFVILAITTLVLWLSYLVVSCYFTARFQTLVWGKTRVGHLALHSDISFSTLLILQTKNLALVILTLGLYRPVAAIRVARYRLQAIGVTGVDALDGFDAGVPQSRHGATGEGAAELFEMDLGL
jgi:uncharacterized membrane protein YjgN (DUF898 family)